MVEPITEPEFDLAESPVWDDRIDRLYWVDINRGDLIWLDWGTNAVQRRHAGSPLASVRLAIDGRLVLGRGGKLYTTAEPRRRLQFVAQIDHDGSGGNGEAPWDLVTRNGQEAESGVYLFTVDSPVGRTVGRFVVIR